MAAFSTPGTARSRSTASAKNAFFRGSGQAGPASENWTVCRLCGIEPRIDPRQPQHAVNHQSGSGEQHRRDRHFPNQQAAAQQRALAGRAAARPQRHRVAIGVRRPECGQQAEEERTAATEQRRARQHHDVQADLVEAWCIRGRDGHQPAENRGAGNGAEHPTGPHQQCVFDEQLANEAPPGAADRRADAELVGPRRAPVQQQAGQVDAGNEQQQRDGAREHGQRGGHVPDDAVAQGHDEDAAAGVRLRVFQGQRGHDVLHFRPRRGHVHARLEPSDGIETRATVALHPAIVRRHLRLEQQVHVGRGHVTEARRQDADHRERRAHRDGLTDRGRCAAKLTHREGVAHDESSAAPGRASDSSKRRP